MKGKVKKKGFVPSTVDAFKDLVSPLSKDGGVNAFLKALGLVKDEKYYQKRIADQLERNNELLKQQLERLNELSK